MRQGARLVLMVLLALLAGCAEPQARVQTVPLAPLTPSEACEGTSCSYEWWNLTLEGAGWREARVPLPIILGLVGDAARDASPWGRNLTLAEGLGGAVMGVAERRAFASVEGNGPLSASAHRVRSAGPTGHAEDFLRARWGPELNETRPDAVPLHLRGTLEGATLTYEAHGGLCERRAVYRLAGPATAEGIHWMPGHDEVTCR